MRREKQIEAVWCIAAVLGLVILAATLWVAQSEPQGYFSGEAGFSVRSQHAACDWICQMIIGYFVYKGLDWIGDQTSSQNNNCNGACGGGGGGGFQCDDNDTACAAKMDTW